MDWAFVFVVGQGQPVGQRGERLARRGLAQQRGVADRAAEKASARHRTGGSSHRSVGRRTENRLLARPPGRGQRTNPTGRSGLDRYSSGGQRVGHRSASVGKVDEQRNRWRSLVVFVAVVRPIPVGAIKGEGPAGVEGPRAEAAGVDQLLEVVP